MKLGLYYFVGIFFVWTSWGQTTTSGPLPSTSTDKLTFQTYLLNNAFQYDSSIVLLRGLIDNPKTSNIDRYYAFLHLSYTYKRLFDYKSTLEQLDSALVCGRKTPYWDYFEANISCQKAYVFFDTHRYKEADQRMKELARTNYKYLDEEQKAKIMMQEAYLLYLNQEYNQAEGRYNLALTHLYKSSDCDVPMIYTKLMQLYGKMGDETNMLKAAKRSLAAADSCKITKYKLYTYNELYRSYEALGNIRAAYRALKTYDSLNTIYKQEEHLSILKDRELKYQQEKNKINTQLFQTSLKNEQQKNLILIGILLTLSGIVAYILLWQRQRQLKREKEISLHYTKQLLENTEEERKRIASDLHDSINYELLSLRKSFYPRNAHAEDKIDQIINDVRNISRNLRPVMFDKIGLTPNLEQLVERLQEQHNLMISTEIDYHRFLTTEGELHLYRIIQEALTNVIKYAKAHAAKITLNESSDKLVLWVQDNGVGFDVAKTLTSTNSFGIHNIIERSRIIGGTTKIHSSAEGTLIEVTINK